MRSSGWEHFLISRISSGARNALAVPENGASDDDGGSVYNDNASVVSANSDCSFFQADTVGAGEEGVDELSQEEQFLEKVKEAIDLATQKSAAGRTKALEALCHALLKK